MTNQTITARIVTNDNIGAKITSNSNLKSNLKTSSNINAEINSLPSATTERKGIIRIATNEEAIEGIANNLAITPQTLKLVSEFTFVQHIPSRIWNIVHNLNKRASVTVVDTSDKVQVPDEIVYIDNNEIELQFISEFSGKAYLN